MLDLRLSFSLFICLFSSFSAFAAPSKSDRLPRDVASQLSSADESLQPSTAFPVNSHANVTTITNTSALIRDSNGVDITSTFQVKIYNPPPPHSITNISDKNQLNTRQPINGMTQVVKVINRCPNENHTFVESHCTPHENTDMPFQAFVYTCRKIVDHWGMSGNYMGQIPAYQSFHDVCQPSELCVDGFGDKQVASCVHTALFDDYMIDKDGIVKGMLHGEIFDVGKAWAVIMSKDKMAPLKAKKLGMDTWSSREDLMKPGRQRKSCAYCAELETDQLQPNVDSLRLEATLMSAGTIAAGGILWLAMGAG